MLLKMASPSLVHLNVFKLTKLNFTVVYLGHAFFFGKFYIVHTAYCLMRTTYYFVLTYQ